jgi:putative heme-binding domain-containing protein
MIRLLLGAVLLAAPAAGTQDAQWIWKGSPARPQERLFFRKSFEVGAVESARVHGTADNRFVLYVNGQEAARSDDWTAPVWVDLAPHLQPGRNVLAVEASNDDGPAGLLLRFLIRTTDGKSLTFGTDAGWKVSDRADPGWSMPAYDDSAWAPAAVLGPPGIAPWGDVLAGQPAASEASAAPRDALRVRDGFRVDLVYSVPKATQGSWVSLAVDPKGRLIASDQENKGLFRITLRDGRAEVEKIEVPVSGAQGLVWAFDALYAGVNGKGSGLWRIRDTDGDDRLDQAEQLFALKGAGEHGPHAVLVTEDGRGLYVVAGNHTLPPPGLTGSRIPTNWGEDLLLPRQWDAGGHAVGILAPGGWICRVSPDGREREMFSIGYRNQYDAAISPEGEMFTFDSDMEWDLGLPWYRPTRVFHVVSGSEFGWRSGSGVWPDVYPDCLPGVVDIGPASPTGVLFGTGARFPARYQRALYILDWTYGTIWAVHLKPKGASYEADVEEFVSGTPLPVTDAVIGKDGAFYFTVGGRGTQSALYRVTYVGPEPVDPAPPAGPDAGAAARETRRRLERFHGRRDPGAVEAAWPYLGHPDRFLRYAARIAIESQPVESWKDRALSERDPQALPTALVALARQGPKEALAGLLGALERLDLAGLPEPLVLDALRAYQLAFIRLGPPPEELRRRAAARLDAHYPHRFPAANRELAQLLVYLESPTVVEKSLRLMREAGPAPRPKWVTAFDRNRGYGGVVQKMLAKMPPAEGIHYAFVLRNARTGWTPERRKEYFAFLKEAAEGYAGGNSYRGYLINTWKEAMAHVPLEERAALPALSPPRLSELPKPKGPGREWTVQELLPLVEKGLRQRSFPNGRRMFLAAQCIVCHRFDAEGGSGGPDLTGVAGRFGVHDLLESIVEPSKVISDQYQGTVLRTRDGQVLSGRVVGEKDGKLQIATDLLKPDQIVEIPKSAVEDSRVSTVSLMPTGLLNPLNADEVLDLVAYLLSGGNPEHPAFR